LAEIVTLFVPVTADVVMMKVAVDCPPAICTLDGVWAEPLLEERLTVRPPDGAAPFSVSVPFVDTPPSTEFGLMERLAKPIGATVKVADCELDPTVPVITADPPVVEALVVTLKVAEFLPPGTFTVPMVGLAIPLLLDERFTTMPFDGALPFSVMVPVEALPATTLVGSRVTDDTCTV